jgi:serine/threonine protein phosphatase PrpC
MLTRAVGTGEPLDLVDTRIDLLKSKDCYLLCTDGLYNAITQKCILDLLTKQSIAADIAAELVTNSFQSGASDNITAVVVKLVRYGKTNQNTEQCI